MLSSVSFVSLNFSSQIPVLALFIKNAFCFELSMIKDGIDTQAGLCEILAITAEILSLNNTEHVVLVLSCPVCYWQAQCFDTRFGMKFKISLRWLIGKV